MLRHCNVIASANGNRLQFATAMSPLRRQIAISYRDVNARSPLLSADSEMSSWEIPWAGVLVESRDDLAGQGW